MNYSFPQYWMYRFRNPKDRPHPPGPPGPPPPFSLFVHRNSSEIDISQYDLPMQRNPFQAQITASFNISNAASMTISLLVLILLKDKLPCAQTRIKVALISILVLFIGSALFIWANASGGKHF